MEGTIKKIVRDRGFGFIRVQGHEIFFHRSGLEELEFESLKEGQSVEFKLERRERGLQAIKVRMATAHAYEAPRGQQERAVSYAAGAVSAEHP
jgi:cold shock CspA family protein